jgi:hypothetical protein
MSSAGRQRKSRMGTLRACAAGFTSGRIAMEARTVILSTSPAPSMTFMPDSDLRAARGIQLSTSALGPSPGRKLNCIQPLIERYPLLRHQEYVFESIMCGIQHQVIFFRGDHGRNKDAEARFRCHPGIAEAFAERPRWQFAPAARQFVHRYFYNGVIRNFNDDLQSCARIGMRGMDPQFQHTEGLVRSTVEHESAFAIPAPPVSTSIFGRQPIGKPRLRESVDLHRGGRKSNRQAVFDCAKFSGCSDAPARQDSVCWSDSRGAW